ncbi:hypothetical protein CGRA01v4_12418 [Colletotrichum graminicola]|nr:hypothetical protein CGRA01v4_12418 [Colletotrichum graminicola]
MGAVVQAKAVRTASNERPSTACTVRRAHQRPEHPTVASYMVLLCYRHSGAPFSPVAASSPVRFLSADGR